ncbi:CUB and sushi domain-containing protein 1-like [Mercenaria mercenaria]|uniref:CUB and sushi domain-containing protein 1-like n=1 Tax=Mercenaria mercenaria TaxID=6596 RepID=UPI00234F15D5|nr:CUB and sushi domain-containing protein 1-like [Mercenaria mercenaria]
MTVYYTCDSGYTLSGQDSRLCSIDGTGWAGFQPSCVFCPTVSAPTGGSVTVATDGTTSRAYFTCNLEYTMDGSPTTTCTVNGTWDTVAPTCVQCSGLSDPDSGSVTLTTDGEQTIASYNCVTGYQISGVTPLTCQTDGQWSDSEPTCVCTPPLTPTDGLLEISDDGMTATFTCTAGYTLKGVSTRTCQSNGAGWNEAQPTCETCDALSNPTGGTVSLTTSGTVTVADITCQTGYTINGASTLTCRTDGTWDISVPTCGVCSALSSPSSGTVDLYSENSVTKANFSCESGYSLSGASILTCRTDGSWDFTEPVCAKCTDLQTVNAGTINVYSDGLSTFASVSCASDYYLNGDGMLTCNSDGSWDYELPSCVCNPLTKPSNGSITISSSGMLADFSCDVGFTLDGSTNASCSEDGSGWDNNIPTCVSCPQLASVTDGSMEVITDGTTTTWALSCDVGTSISSTGTLSCQTDGTWSTVQPSCVACPAIDSPISGEVMLQTDGETTLALFTCDLGYSMIGNEISACLPDGTWNSTAPTCGACASLHALDSGDITYNTNGVVTMATFSCNSGYYVSGAANISCLQDGSWEDDQPSCGK